ncbi:MAG: hypothetical protein KGM97_05765, partial [Alphaproteobacteria bacterium]|nr:hypothetical protein [Alphaproteobacteria bacterium]
ILLLLCTVAAAPAAAPKEGAPGTNVEMPFLIAPMSKDGKLLGYAYISSKTVASSQSAAIAVREKLAFIQDAFVRDVNTRSISKADDPTAIDTALLNARLLAAAKRIVGGDKVVRIVFTAAQFAPLHPSDSTLNLAPTSDKAPATGAVAPGPAPAPAPSNAPAAAPSPAASNPAQGATH